MKNKNDVANEIRALGLMLTATTANDIQRLKSICDRLSNIISSTDAGVIHAVYEMAIESVSPNMLDDLKNILEHIRKNRNIDVDIV